MDVNLNEIAHAVSAAIASGEKVEILTPAISAQYEVLASFEVVGEGVAQAIIKGTSWLSYLIPVSAIVGFRLSDVPEDDAD